MNFSLIIAQVLAGLALGAILALVASGFSLVFGMMDIVNAAHGIFFALGSYFGYTLLALIGNFWIVLFLVPVAVGRFEAFPSEGGHANFPFVAKKESQFGEFLLRELGDEYITANMVVSGRGLSYTHKFLTGEELHPDEIAERISHDSETLIWASRFYGRVCRNYALEVLGLGGVYIAGGVAAKMPELVRHEAFAAEFRSSRTLGDLLKKIPVFLITNEESGLWGGAVLGLQEIAWRK
jgi:glucokinase